MIKQMTREQLKRLESWAFYARPEQLLPAGQWTGWLVLAGRGYGKTRIGAEAVNEKARTTERIGLIAETAADARDVMVEGESGIIAHSPEDFMPHYEPSKRRLTWPNGSKAFTYSGDDPEQMRGPQHGFVWADDIAKWRHLRNSWDNMEFGLRLGDDPRWVATTTPRPIPLLREMIKDLSVVVTRGNTYDNAPNVPKTFINRITKRYKGTRLGRQEIYAEIIEDTPGALWTQALIEKHRITTAPDMVRIVVAIDPPATSGEESSEAGIVVVGKDGKKHGYTLDDRSQHATPLEWASAGIDAFNDWNADLIVAEKNNGGEMVEHTLRSVNPKIPVKLVHASRGKYTRAEPISALYEQGEFHHVGVFGALEDQMCTYVPGEESPDHMDALVWGATELFPNLVLPGPMKKKKMIGV